MNTAPGIIAVVVVAMATLAIGTWGLRISRTTSDFFVASRTVAPRLNASAIGGEMTSNPTVKALTFTGSTEIGKVLMEQCAGTVKKVGMELGGNAPFIVFDDADLDAAVDAAMLAKFRNIGEACTAANRFLVHEDVAEEFKAKFAAALGKLNPGETSPVLVLDGYGYIVRKDEQQDARPLTFEEAAPYVESHLRMRQAEKLYKEWTDRLRAESYIKVFELPTGK